MSIFAQITPHVAEQIISKTDDYPIVVSLLLGAIIVLGSSFAWFIIRFIRNYESNLKEANQQREELAKFVRQQIPEATAELHRIGSGLRKIESDFGELKGDVRPGMEKIRGELAALDLRLSLIEQKAK